MSCSSCKYLKENDKKDGAVCGCCYYCSKKEKYVNGSNNVCDKYALAYCRDTYTCNKIFEDGDKYCDDSTDIGVYLILLIFLIIALVIVKVFNI